MDCEGGHCFFGASSGNKKDEDKEQKDQKLGTVTVAMDDPFLRKAESKHVNQTLRTSKAVQIYAVSGACVAQWFFEVIRKGSSSQIS